MKVFGKLWLRLAALALSGMLAVATTSCFGTSSGTTTTTTSTGTGTTVQGTGSVSGTGNGFLPY